MKFIVLCGGACGFAVAGGTSLWGGHSADRFLIDAALGSLAGGLLFLGFWTVLLRGIREAYLSRREALAKPAAPKPAPTTP